MTKVCLSDSPPLPWHLPASLRYMCPLDKGHDGPCKPFNSDWPHGHWKSKTEWETEPKQEREASANGADKEAT